jgi:hypothetical protein
MTAWGDLIDAGYSRVLGLAIEGIPYAFLETRLLTTADVDIASPSGVGIVRGALRVRESDAISSELDRVAGLARGRSVDFVLALDVLAANSVTLFRQPTLRAKLTADLDGTATTVTVDSTTGWDTRGPFISVASASTTTARRRRPFRTASGPWLGGRTTIPAARPAATALPPTRRCTGAGGW